MRGTEERELERELETMAWVSGKGAREKQLGGVFLITDGGTCLGSMIDLLDKRLIKFDIASRLRHKKGRQYIIKRMIGTKEKRLHGLKTWLLRVELRVKLNRWMKPDELYSECVRLRRPVLKRLQGDAEVEQVCSGSRKCRHKERVMDLD
ncbi:hypothetical protein Bca4012_050128 [Brassica carinata]